MVEKVMKFFLVIMLAFQIMVLVHGFKQRNSHLTSMLTTLTASLPIRNNSDTSIIGNIENNATKSDAIAENSLESIRMTMSMNSSLVPSEFSRELSELLSSNDLDSTLSSLAAAEALFNDYVNMLRDSHVQTFIKHILTVDMTSKDDLHDAKIKYCLLCRKSMEEARPNLHFCSNWDIEGPLIELNDDIDSLISKAGLNDAMTEFKEEGQRVVEDEISGFGIQHLKKNSHKILKHPWIESVVSRIDWKWFAAQLIMLSYSFLQNELNRRTAIRMANKRLAEVPEFPLL